MSVRLPAGGGGRAPPADAVAQGDAQRLYSIGELASELEITTRAIRFYEAKGLIAPVRRGAQRSYSRRDRARLKIILRGKNLGFTLEEVAQYLKLYDADPSQIAQTRMLLSRVEQAIADLQAKRADLDHTLKELRKIRAACVDHLNAEDPDARGKCKE
jgi:DNA-binding transcriptional MerR regulator